MEEVNATRSEIERKIGEVLVYPDGRSVTFLESGKDEDGEYIILKHQVLEQRALNGPHWHPVLKETFKVKEGRMKFLIDGQEMILNAGEQITVNPRQIHQFWNLSEGQLVATHKIQPPGLHWKMFALVHKLEHEGKMGKNGIPRNPFWLGLAWECIDGYLHGPPRFIQTYGLGGLAKLAKKLGYKVSAK
ncbi:cupin domain-containing protein [Evansella halocellulosilytica]|uniref:cupin domain-containing protein n=1 Tax=Evansella halocellulosilytica TaxID=2011013 RepID=UPI000BB97CA9|nr:cupin domain-containing protein [Evansella halocellulosilytica]